MLNHCSAQNPVFIPGPTNIPDALRHAMDVQTMDLRATVFTGEIAQAVAIGECQRAIADGSLVEKDITGLGAVINGGHAGRIPDDEATLFDGTGVGLQDLAVASAAVDLAVGKGVAIDVDFCFFGRKVRKVTN